MTFNKKMTYPLICVFMAGCGGTLFNGSVPNNDRSVAKSGSSSNGSAPFSQSTSAMDKASLDTVAGQNIPECLKHFASHPFGDNLGAVAANKTLEMKNKNNRNVFVDDSNTAENQLISVTIAAKNINHSVIELLNPKGWYCLDLVGKNANGLVIRVHCEGGKPSKLHLAAETKSDPDKFDVQCVNE